MTVVPDHEILNLFRSGHKDTALQKIVEAYGKTVYNVALFTLNDELAAEDITQDVFIKIYKGLGQFRGHSSISSWLYRITKNACFDLLKKKKADPLDNEQVGRIADNDRQNPEGDFFERDKHNAVRAAVSKLGEQQRMAVSLYYFQQLSYEEIAEIMGQPLNTVKSYLFRGKKVLAAELAAFEEDYE